jgi:hypothetical protein
MPSPNDFEKYTRDARGEAPHINFFLAQIVQCVNPDTADKFCRSAIANLYERRSGKDGQPGTPSSRCTFASYYRQALKQAAIDFGMPAEISDICIPILKGSDSDIAIGQDKQQKRTRKHQSNLIPFNPQAVLAQIETALNSDDWRQIAAALVMCCHARPADILKLGSFKVLSEYQVEFTSPAKKRGGRAVGNIWVMIPAADFVDAFSRLRRMPEVLRYQAMSNSEVDSSSNSNIGRAIQQTFGEVLSLPHGAKGTTSATNARAAATNLAHWLYGTDEIHAAELSTRQLMHDSTNAEANYRDYRLVGENGQAIKDYGVRLNLGPTVPYYFYAVNADGLCEFNEDGSVKKNSMMPDDNPAVISVSSSGKITVNAKSQTKTMPKSQTKTSLTIDRQLLAEMDSFGPGSRSDQLINIMATARQSEELQAQLAYQKEQVAKLKATAAAAPQTAPVTGDYATTTEATTTAETDLRMLQDSELKGKKSGLAEERIRRTVAALQDWNAGKELEEQIEINVGSLRQLAAASASKVGAWAKDHAAELQAYADGQGHPFTKNSKFNRGKDIAALVSLPWNE